MALQSGNTSHVWRYPTTDKKKLAVGFTCTVLTVSTLFSSMSMSEYVPNLAEWPMPSLLPSPPSITCFPFREASKCLDLSSQTRLMVECKYFLWCMKYVEGEIVARPIKFNTRNVFLGSAPANRIPADKSRFPSGIPAILGWLDHLNSVSRVASCMYYSHGPNNGGNGWGHINTWTSRTMME